MTALEQAEACTTAMAFKQRFGFVNGTFIKVAFVGGSTAMVEYTPQELIHFRWLDLAVRQQIEAVNVFIPSGY